MGLERRWPTDSRRWSSYQPASAHRTSAPTVLEMVRRVWSKGTMVLWASALQSCLLSGTVFGPVPVQQPLQRSLCSTQSTSVASAANCGSPPPVLCPREMLRLPAVEGGGRHANHHHRPRRAGLQTGTLRGLPRLHATPLQSRHHWPVDRRQWPLATALVDPAPPFNILTASTRKGKGTTRAQNACGPFPGARQRKGGLPLEPGCRFPVISAGNPPAAHCETEGLID